MTRFEQLVKQNELNPTIAEQLRSNLSNCTVVLLCDDSSSMSKAIAEEGTDPFAIKKSTRLLELKKLAQNIIEIVTAINRNGLDIYFLNKQTVRNVDTISGLQGIFRVPPNDETPLITAISNILFDYNNIPNNRLLLLIVITDGEPINGSRNDLLNLLLSKASNVHVSFAECTNNVVIITRHQLINLYNMGNNQCNIIKYSHNKIKLDKLTVVVLLFK